MNVEGIKLSEIRWTEKEKCFDSYVESIKQNKYNKTETRSQIQRTSQQLPQSGRGGKIDKEDKEEKR